MTRFYELIPTARQNQQSFYHKALVLFADDGTETLYSYETPIIRRAPDGELTRLYGGWSMTTGKHVTAFCGLSKREFLALPLAADFTDFD